MAIKLDDYLAKLPKKDRRAIEKQAAELIAEEATLRQLREAREQIASSGGKATAHQASGGFQARTPHGYVPEHIAGLYRGDGWQAGNHRSFPNRAVRINQFEALDPKERPQG